MQTSEQTYRTFDIDGVTYTVDAEDYDRVVLKHWTRSRNYLVTYDEPSRPIALHRYVLWLPNTPGEDIHVDHINDDPRDNRKCNLRVLSCTNHNRRARKTMTRRCTSNYKGVSRHSTSGFRVSIREKNNCAHIFWSLDEHECGLAYNFASRILFGEFARLNDVPPIDLSRSREIEKRVIQKMHNKFMGR